MFKTYCSNVIFLIFTMDRWNLQLFSRLPYKISPPIERPWSIYLRRVFSWKSILPRNRAIFDFLKFCFETLKLNLADNGEEIEKSRGFIFQLFWSVESKNEIKTYGSHLIFSRFAMYHPISPTFLRTTL